MLVDLDQVTLQLLSEVRGVVESLVFPSVLGFFFVLSLQFNLEVPVFLRLAPFGLDELFVLLSVIELEHLLSGQVSLLVLELFDGDLVEAWGFVEIFILFEGLLLII